MKKEGERERESHTLHSEPAENRGRKERSELEYETNIHIHTFILTCIHLHSYIDTWRYSGTKRMHEYSTHSQGEQCEEEKQR